MHYTSPFVQDVPERSLDHWTRSIVLPPSSSSSPTERRPHGPQGPSRHQDLVAQGEEFARIQCSVAFFSIFTCIQATTGSSRRRRSITVLESSSFFRRTIECSAQRPPSHLPHTIMTVFPTKNSYRVTTTLCDSSGTASGRGYPFSCDGIIMLSLWRSRLSLDECATGFRPTRPGDGMCHAGLVLRSPPIKTHTQENE